MMERRVDENPVGSLPCTPKLNNIDFPQHCRLFQQHMKIVNLQFEKIKDSVLELYRDVTSKKCVSNYQKIEMIVLDCADIKSEIDEADGLLEQSRMDFKKKWEYELYRIQVEQKMYQGQLSELSSLKEDLSRILKIAQQLEPYVKAAPSKPEEIQHLDTQQRVESKPNPSYRSERVERGEEKRFQDYRAQKPGALVETKPSQQNQLVMEQYTKNDNTPPSSRQQSKSLPRRNKAEYFQGDYGDQFIPPYEDKNGFVWECEPPKQGIISSILDKVCLKNDLSLECLPWRTESLSYRNCSENMKCEKDSSRRSQEDLDFVQKPYEPPCLGKSSRITPVKTGNEDIPPGVKPLKYSDSIEVLSVIRYNNKLKTGNSPSPVSFDSGSDGDSIYGQPNIKEVKLGPEKMEGNRKHKGREMSRSMSISHPPGEDSDQREDEIKPEKRFFSLGRSQHKDVFSKYEEEEKRACMGSTDLRKLHCSEPSIIRIPQPVEPLSDRLPNISFQGQTIDDNKNFEEKKIYQQDFGNKRQYQQDLGDNRQYQQELADKRHLQQDFVEKRQYQQDLVDTRQCQQDLGDRRQYEQESGDKRNYQQELGEKRQYQRELEEKRQFQQDLESQKNVQPMRQRHQSQASQLSNQTETSCSPLCSKDNLENEPVYREPLKLNNRHLDLIGQLISPNNRDQAHQIKLLSQLLQSDLTQYKTLNTEMLPETQLRSQGQYSERSITYTNSAGPAPTRGFIQSGENEPVHDSYCEMNRQVRAEDRKYNDLEESRIKLPQEDLIQQLLQAELNQGNFNKSDLLDQLLGIDHSRDPRSNKSKEQDIPLNSFYTNRSESSKTLPRNRDSFEDKRRVIKDKGCLSGKQNELKKRNSFEGHELAVECLVNAVQECRKAGHKIRRNDE